MKTMKVIDLLNKIANREEVPKKIKYNHETFIFNDNLKRYVEINNKDSDSSTYCLGGFFALDMSLNEKVEIIEEKSNKIKEFELRNDKGDTLIGANMWAIYYKLNELTKSLNYLLEKENKDE